LFCLEGAVSIKGLKQAGGTVRGWHGMRDKNEGRNSWRREKQEVRSYWTCGPGKEPNKSLKRYDVLYQGMPNPFGIPHALIS
jgi:hypothetical protein